MEEKKNNSLIRASGGKIDEEQDITLFTLWQGTASVVLLSCFTRCRVAQHTSTCTWVHTRTQLCKSHEIPSQILRSVLFCFGWLQVYCSWRRRSPGRERKLAHTIQAPTLKICSTVKSDFCLTWPHQINCLFHSCSVCVRMCVCARPCVCFRGCRQKQLLA